MARKFSSFMAFSVFLCVLNGDTFVLAQSPRSVAPPIQRAFNEAEALFENLQQSQALELFIQVVDSLMPSASAGVLSETERDMLLKSLSYRARAGFNIGQSDDVDRALELAISLDPGFECVSRLISPRLIEACGRMRAELVGHLELRVRPSDAEVELDGRPMAATVGPIDILAGSHVVTASRPGYASERVSIEVRPGILPTFHEVSLTRTSAVLRILTRPPGATVHVNTIQYGPTKTSAQSGEFSDELTVAGIRPGAVSVVVTLDGFRTVRRDLNLSEPVDYPTSFELDRAEGTIVFGRLPSGSTVEIGRQGEDEMRLVALDAGRLKLPIGVYNLAVSHPDAGYYDSTARVVDRQEYVVPVRLRPSLTVLGVLGVDSVRRDTVIRSLNDALRGVDQWTLEDRTEAGPSILKDAGLTLERFRRLGSPWVVQDDPIDWESAQESSINVGRSSVYLAAVLDNDQSATYVDFWMWRSPPHAALASRIRVPFSAEGGQDVTSALSRVFSDTQLVRPWLGAVLIDVDSESGPFVLDVTDESPAQQAGLEVGDVIVAVDGRVPPSSSSVYESITDSIGERLPLQISRHGMSFETELTVGESPLVSFRDGGDFAYAVTAASLAALRMRRPSDHPDWVWELNDAAIRVYGGDFDGGLESLLRAEQFVPNGSGVSKGTVDYWLGMLFTLAGPEFRVQAKESFIRATEDADARLRHNDGPWLASRARARLASLIDVE